LNSEIIVINSIAFNVNAFAKPISTLPVLETDRFVSMMVEEKNTFDSSRGGSEDIEI